MSLISAGSISLDSTFKDLLHTTWEAYSPPEKKPWNFSIVSFCRRFPGNRSDDYWVQIQSGGGSGSEKKDIGNPEADPDPNNRNLCTGTSVAIV